MKEEPVNFSLAAANVRYGADNQKAYLEALASQLQGALPSMVTIERSFSLIKKNRVIKEIVIILGDQEYRLNHSQGKGIQTYLGNRVRGVILKTESIQFYEWLQKLVNQVANYAHVDNLTNQSLEAFLLGN